MKKEGCVEACCVEGCEKPSLNKGMCSLHYYRMLRRGKTDDPAYGSATHCSKGHEWTEENTNYYKGDPYRHCKECGRDRAREYQRKLAAKKPKKEPPTHCVHGHEWTPVNTGHNKVGSKYCKSCTRNRTNEYRARKEMERYA